MTMILYAFSIESMIRGYHEYKLVCDNPFVGKDLLCEQEVGNPHNMHAVAVKKVIGGNCGACSMKNIFNLLHILEMWWYN